MSIIREIIAPTNARVFCHCGQDCDNASLFHKTHDGDLIVLLSDRRGHMVELMVDRKGARHLMWWFIKSFWRKGKHGTNGPRHPER